MSFIERKLLLGAEQAGDKTSKAFCECVITMVLDTKSYAEARDEKTVANGLDRIAENDGDEICWTALLYTFACSI